MSGASPADLEALGFRREGDIWFDESGTTMVAFHRRSGEDLASVQSVLEDGTNVLTEARGSFLAWLRRPVATKLPTEGLSVAFPLDVYDVKQLVAAHRAHVERTEAKRKSNVKSEHTERSDNRDEAAFVRRRVAVEEEAEEAVPYRARIASPEELGEALLDSAEARGVRIRAAKRLARSEDEDAARIREEAEARVLDPDVRHALDRPRE